MARLLKAYRPLRIWWLFTEINLRTSSLPWVGTRFWVAGGPEVGGQWLGLITPADGALYQSKSSSIPWAGSGGVASTLYTKFSLDDDKAQTSKHCLKYVLVQTLSNVSPSPKLCPGCLLIYKSFKKTQNLDFVHSWCKSKLCPKNVEVQSLPKLWPESVCKIINIASWD